MDWATYRHLSQRHLASSPGKQLCLVTPPLRKSLPEPSELGKCFISLLPDELLLKILEHLSPFVLKYEEVDYREWFAIVSVCQRWRRLYEPLLYRRIDLCPAGNWLKVSKRLTDRMKRFQKSVKRRPEISDRVREISLRIKETYDDVRLATDVISPCLKIRSLSLYLTITPEVWPLLRAISRLPCLELLTLWPLEGGISIQMILTLFNLPTLKQLETSRYGLSQDGGPAAPHDYFHDVVQKSDESFTPSVYESAVTTLHLGEPSTLPHVTKILLQWPRQLVNLSFYPYHSRFARCYNVDVMQQLLDTQRDSLEHIKLGSFSSREDAGIPNFSRFSHLHTLKLSAHNIFTEYPHYASAKLLTPSLHRLEISFCSEDQHSNSAFSFTSEHVIWLDLFTSSPTWQGTTLSRRLETIFVEFDDDRPYCYGDNENVDWPWEYLEQAAQALSQRGVLLNYRMEWSRQEWRQKIKDQREASDETGSETEDETDEELEDGTDDEMDCSKVAEMLTRGNITPVTGPGAIDFYFRSQRSVVQA